MTESADDARSPSFAVVGLGASAGGVGALQAFFKAAPEAAGVAYVVVQHLSPDTQSHLAEILGRATAMPVVEVLEDVAPEPDRVYVIAPDESLVLEDGLLRIRPAGDRPRHPVDRFFESLAAALGPRAVGVVLSGTGSNGSAGALRIKSASGAVFAQDPEEAAPASIVARGRRRAVGGATARGGAGLCQPRARRRADGT